MNRLFAPLPSFIFLALLACILGGCRSEASSKPLADRLYALYLDHTPSESDWAGALPREVIVKGGRTHKANPLPDIDSDTVHVTTASCHHGSTPPAPLSVDMRAFYTETELYLRLSWPDGTRDDAMRQWRYDGNRWQASARLEDGFGILWDNDGRFNKFTCSYACHIDNFGVSGANFHAVNRMKLPRDEGVQLDLWNWKAGRTGRYGFVDDRTLDVKGMEGDTPGEIFQPNSQLKVAGKGEPDVFGPEDRPVYDAEGAAIDKAFRPVGSLAHGYLTERPIGSRADIAAAAEYRDRRWTVVLHRPLSTGDRRDVVFSSTRKGGIPFGLSVMDDTLKEHYASVAPEYLVLLDRGAGLERR